MVSAVAGRAAYTEVKAIREGRVNLKDSCGKVEAGEVFLHNLHVSPYSHRGYAEHEPLRRRKLLLNKREIGLVKVTVGVAKGKKTYDKRETIERRRIDRETRAMVKNAPENGPGADGRRPGSSLDRIADALLAGREARAFVDRVVSPSYVEDVSAATVALLRAEPAHGLYHCVGSGHATWLDVAAALAGELGVEPVIRGITLDELELRASRPRFCALSNRKLSAAGVEMPPWRDALARYAAIRLRFGSG